MKAKLFFIGAIFLLVISAFAQTMVERTFVIRTETTSVDPYVGMSHTCLVVFPDGRYRMETSVQGMSGSDPNIKVYLDKLPDADLKALQSALNDSKFAEIKTAPPRGGIIKDMDTLYITIPREHSVQNLNFNNAADRRPFDKDLKPFLSSLKSIEKRKVAIAKGEASNNCEAPRVMYRSDHPMPMPDSN